MSYELSSGCVVLLVPVLLSRRVIQQILPLHCSRDISYLRDNWVQAFFHRQPLGEQHCDVMFTRAHCCSLS